MYSAELQGLYCPCAATAAPVEGLANGWITLPCAGLHLPAPCQCMQHHRWRPWAQGMPPAMPVEGPKPLCSTVAIGVWRLLAASSAAATVQRPCSSSCTCRRILCVSLYPVLLGSITPGLPLVCHSVTLTQPALGVLKLQVAGSSMYYSITSSASPFLSAETSAACKACRVGAKPLQSILLVVLVEPVCLGCIRGKTLSCLYLCRVRQVLCLNIPSRTAGS